MEKRFEWLWTQLEKLAGDSCKGREHLDVVATGIELAKAETTWRCSQRTPFSKKASEEQPT